MSDTARPFYQFPLRLLAYGKNQDEKINTIIAYSTIMAGFHKEKALGGQSAALKFLKGKIKSRNYSGYRDEHRAWALGKEIVSYTWHDTPSYCVECYHHAANFLRAFEKSPQVRVDWELTIDTKKGNFQFRDFAVLCAVYAVIGDKQSAIVRRDRVRAGALGLNSAKEIFDEDGNVTEAGKQLLAQRADGAAPLTINQCRHTLNRLHNRKFFSRIQPGKCGRAVHYSRNLDHDALATLILGRLERKNSAAFAQGEAQAALREKSAPLLKRLTRGDAKLSPESDRTVTAGVTAPFTAGVTALISSSYKCFPNACSSNECKSNGELASKLESGGPIPPDPEPDNKPFSFIDRADFDQFLATCLKAWLPHAEDYWAKVCDGQVKGDQKLAFMRYASDSESARKSAERFKAMRSQLEKEADL